MNKKPNGQDTLRTEAEAQLARTPETAREGCTAPLHTAEGRLHELQVHQIELEMQNEQLRQNQCVLEESRDLYMDLYGFVPIGYITLTRLGMISEINLTAAVLLGVEQNKLLNRQFKYFVMPEDSECWHQYFMDAVQYGKKQSCELALKRGDGSVFPARLTCPHIGAGSESPIRIALIDITKHRHAEEELRIATIAFETQEGMMLTDPNGVILRVNRAFTQLTGYSAEEVVGKTPALLRSGHHDPSFYRCLWATLAEKRYWQGEIWNRHKDGKSCAEWMTITAVTMPDGWRVTHYVSTYSNIVRDDEMEQCTPPGDIPLGLLQAIEPLSVLPQH